MQRARAVLAIVGLILVIPGLVLAGSLFRGPMRAFARFLLEPSPDQMGTAVVLSHVDEGLPLPLILGYYDSSGGVAELRHYLGILNGIVPFWYTIHADGSITGSADPEVLRFALKHRLWVFALVQNMSGPLVYHRLFSDPLARARALENLLALCETEGYDGVNLDFEGIAPGDRNRYTRFVDDLTRLFHANGYYVTLSVPAETEDNPDNSWTGAYDYRQLGRAADLVMVMAYDEHSVDSPAGPIATPSWVDAVLRYTTSVIPPTKVVLGLPAYGYDWSSQGTNAIGYQEWRTLVAEYGGRGGHLQYWQGGVLHQVYYEDLQSFEASVRLAVGYDLRGIVLWRLGIENPSIWPFVGS
jgi:spore germination protein